MSSKSSVFETFDEGELRTEPSIPNETRGNFRS